MSITNVLTQEGEVVTKCLAWILETAQSALSNPLFVIAFGFIATATAIAYLRRLV